MIRLNLPWLVEVVEIIDGLDALLADQPIIENLRQLISTTIVLEQLFNESIYGNYLRSSREAGRDLHDEVDRHLNDDKWRDAKFSEFQVATIKNKKATFKTIFLADLGTTPAYLVAKKDNFDVNLLIDEGIRLFPQQIITKAPEVEKDATEVGRSLAYELPTASGFHTFRVTESIVRRYWDHASGGKDRPSLQTLGSFAAEMTKQKFGDQKIIESITQMTKLHRNPLIHPEVILTVEEAIGIIGMARSVIAAIINVLPDAPITTGAPSTGELP